MITTEQIIIHNQETEVQPSNQHSNSLAYLFNGPTVFMLLFENRKNVFPI